MNNGFLVDNFIILAYDAEWYKKSSRMIYNKKILRQSTIQSWRFAVWSLCTSYIFWVVLLLFLLFYYISIMIEISQRYIYHYWKTKGKRENKTNGEKKKTQNREQLLYISSSLPYITSFLLDKILSNSVLACHFLSNPAITCRLQPPSER